MVVLNEINLTHIAHLPGGRQVRTSL